MVCLDVYTGSIVMRLRHLLLSLQITQIMQQAEKRLEERLAGPAMALLDGAADNMWPRLQHLLASCSGEASKVRLYQAGGVCWRTLEGSISNCCRPSPVEEAGPGCGCQYIHST